MEKSSYYYWQFRVENIAIGIIADDYESAKVEISFLFPKMSKTINLVLESVSENWLPGVAYRDFTTTMTKIVESEK